MKVFSEHFTEIQKQLAKLPSDLNLAVALTGGGSWIAPMLAARVGASTNLVEIVVPYSRQALARYLEINEVTRACSESTAQLMAETARRRAAHGSSSSGQSVGMARTCILPSDRQEQSPVAYFAIDGHVSLVERLEIEPVSERSQAEKWVARQCLARLCRLYCSA
ncbi:MAG: CinA family protein [Planctomycetota bacterium]